MRTLSFIAAGLMALLVCGEETATAAPQEAKQKEVAKDVATKKAEQQKPSLADRYAAVMKKYDDAMNEFRVAYMKEKEEDRQAYVQKHLPKPDKTAEELMKLVKGNEADPATLNALQWVAMRATGAPKEAAIDVLFAHHMDSPVIAQVLARMAYDPGAATERRLRKLSTEAKTEQMRGTALLSLAQNLSYAERMKVLLRENPEAREYYKDKLEYLENLKVDNKELVKIYETVQKKYGKIKTARGTLGESATSALFELQRLQIGMVAPDIEGADLDGVNFKLTDYRGKVVLLDFWGNW